MPFLDQKFVEVRPGGEKSELYRPRRTPRMVATWQLYNAAARGQVATVNELLAQDANPAWRDNFGFSPLHIAAKNGHTAVVEALLERSVDVNSSSTDGTTALMAAVSTGRNEVVAILLGAGAHIYQTDRGGRNALQQCVARARRRRPRRSHIECLRLLFERHQQELERARPDAAAMPVMVVHPGDEFSLAHSCASIEDATDTRAEGEPDPPAAEEEQSWGATAVAAWGGGRRWSRQEEVFYVHFTAR